MTCQKHINLSAHYYNEQGDLKLTISYLGYKLSADRVIQ